MEEPVRGLVGAIRARNRNEEPSPVVASGLGSVAAVTIANGADNISVYTPLFHTLGIADSLNTIAVFAALVAVWCAAGAWLGSHKPVSPRWDGSVTGSSRPCSSRSARSSSRSPAS
jgi:phage major head subunit gpT-like protein